MTFLMINKIKTSDYLILLFSFVYLLTKSFPMEEGLVNMTIAAVGLICFSYYILKGSKKIKVKALYVGSLFSFWMLLCILMTSNARIENILWIWAYLGVALCLYENGISNIVSTIICYGIILFFVNKAVYYGASELLAESVFLTGSNNNVSTVCLYATSIYYIGHWRNSKYGVYTYIPLIFVLFLSLFYANRGGILASGISIIILFYNNIREEGFTRRNITTIISAAIVLFYFFIKNFDSYGAAMIEKLDRYGSESSRTIIWLEYLYGMFGNPMYFLFGIPATDTSFKYYSYYEGNAHNAFIILHAKYGIVPFLYVLIKLTKSFFYLYRQKFLILIVVALSVVIRSLFDWTAFPGILDVVFWYFILIAIDEFNNVKKNN